MDVNELLLTALRASFVYFFLLLVVRILGKREVGATSAFDLIVALILGEVVDEIIYADVTVLQGVTAIGIVAIWHLVNSWASFKSSLIDRLTGAPPTVVVKNGEEHPKEIRKATLEPEGHVSVLKADASESVKRKDLRLLR